MNWEEVRSWRKAKRKELLDQRLAMPASARAEIASQVTSHIRQGGLLSQARNVGIYWPFKGELDLRTLMLDLVRQGIDVALPVVTEKNQPVEFWAWRPGTKMGRGIWNIPVPAQREPVLPDALIVPLVGFDEAGYRLGYGGGYYDRTLAAARPRPLTIGVGLDASLLDTIHPQPHDIPMDIIVTQSRRGAAIAGSATHIGDDEERTSYAAAPCCMRQSENE